MAETKMVSQRYFTTHLKEIEEPVEVTVKGENGTIRTIGYFIPINSQSEFDLRKLRELLARRP